MSWTYNLLFESFLLFKNDLSLAVDKSRDVYIACHNGSTGGQRNNNTGHTSVWVRVLDIDNMGLFQLQ